MFWELYQMRRIGQASAKASRAQSKAEQSHVYIERLENKIESLALACQSLWEILRENSNLTEKDLENKMEEIDIRDGRLDGKLSNVTDNCPKCQRKTSRRRPTCLYCGTSTEGNEVFGRS